MQGRFQKSGEKELKKTKKIFREVI